MNSGPNQHYIPKFVLKAFRYAKSRGEIWYFKRDEMPERRPIKRTGSQNNFYDSPTDGTSTLDDRISEIENDLAPILDKIRSLNSGDRVEPKDAASIVTHLALRTAHYRDCIGNVLVKASQSISDGIDNSPECIQEYFGIDQATINPRFIEHFWPVLLQEMPEFSEIDPSTSLWGYILFHNVKETFAEFRAKDLFASLYVAQTKLESGKWASNSQNQALSENLEANPHPQETFLETLDWTIRDFPDSVAILPDCVVFAVDSDANAIPSMFAGQALICAVVMPVSPDKHLIGSTDGYALPPTFDFNGEAARMSHNFFVSSRNDDETTRLHPLIGERATAYLEKAVKDAIQDEFQASSPGLSGGGAEKPDSCPIAITPTSRECQYEISTVGFENKEVIEKIRVIVSEFSRKIPLERLDGITIEADYPKATQEIDREFENAPTVETGSNDVSTGIAKMGLVKRAGEVKGRIIISASFVELLASHIPEQVKLGVYVIVRALALVALIGIIEKALPGTMLSAEKSKVDDRLYACVDSALHGYVATRMVSGFGDKHKLIPIECELLIGNIGQMRNVISREKIAYQHHGDLHKFLNMVLPCIEPVLTSSALLGNIATLDETLSHELDELYDVLDQVGLRNWLQEYQNDLESFYKRLGQWESFDEFLFFKVHVEGLLRTFGIFLEES